MPGNEMVFKKSIYSVVNRQVMLLETDWEINNPVLMNDVLFWKIKTAPMLMINDIYKSI